MTETLPTVAQLLTEEELVFPSFTNADALSLGLGLLESAKAQDAPVAIDVVHRGGGKRSMWPCQVRVPRTTCGSNE